MVSYTHDHSVALADKTGEGMSISNTTQSGAKPSILITQIQESNVPYGHVYNAKDRSGREDDR
jgi:hypothetical protein